MNIDNFHVVDIQPWLEVEIDDFKELISKVLSDTVWREIRKPIWDLLDIRITNFIIDQLFFVSDADEEDGILFILDNEIGKKFYKRIKNKL